MTPCTEAFRASLLHFRKTMQAGIFPPYEYIEDALLFVENGRIIMAGTFQDLEKNLRPGIHVTDYSGRIIMPGFVDCHIHYAQTGMIASYGKQLMDWLHRYTYPEELKFVDKSLCLQVSSFFFDELLRNGTTTALVLPTVHEQSVHALFEEAYKKEIRIVSGKIMMDRNAPEGLLDTAEQSYTESKGIIEKWHGKGRTTCAVIPRFALTSSDQQLHAAAALLKETPGLLFHTHLSESREEVRSVAHLFPWSKSYLDVYDHFELVGDVSSFAHGIHLNKKNLGRLRETGSSIIHCPTSNLFLGSGIFDMGMMLGHHVKTGLGTDVGAGTSFSMFKTMAEAYKLSQLNGDPVSPAHLFYMATSGGAAILGLEDKIGSLEKGKEADFIVINPSAIHLLNNRIQQAESLDDILFALMILGDDRIIEHCYINGHNQTPLPIRPSDPDIGQHGTK